MPITTFQGRAEMSKSLKRENQILSRFTVIFTNIVESKISLLFNYLQKMLDK